MKQWSYMAMLAFTLMGSGWVEFCFKLRVFSRIKRAAISIMPISILFLIWDAYAIKRGHWFFDRNQILGIYGPFNIPLEEYLFFIIVPLAAIFTLEAVVNVKPHWRKSELDQ
jgi:lycopene cyclase domain-containing protein